MSNCTNCSQRGCRTADTNMLPDSCPVHDGQWLAQSLELYREPENREITAAAAYTEHAGYCNWTRLEEIARFAGRLGFKRLGLAYCGGLQQEAKVTADYFTNQGFTVVSAVCSVGGVDKSWPGIAAADRFNPDGHETMCNPIGQACIMNEQETELNIVLGLCVGHDSLFFKYSKAPATVLAAKDRVLGHNPLAAVYLARSYYRKLHEPGDSQSS